jgi:hypothetical protein
LVQHLASTVPSEKDVDMEEALASFIRLSSALMGDDQLPEDLAAAYFEQARTALADELPALLTRFTNLLQDGIDPVTALRRHLLPDSRYRALVWDVIGAGVAASLGRIIESV